MRARDAFRLIVTRGGWAPALLADPGRVDHLEVVEIESGEADAFAVCDMGSGLREFGENYVQEFETKAAECSNFDGARFHLIAKCFKQPMNRHPPKGFSCPTWLIVALC